MKRPLCLVITAFVAIIYVCLRLYSIPFQDENIVDGEDKQIVGKVVRKENRIDFQGNKILVLYLKIPNSNEQILVYLSDNSSAIPKMGQSVKVQGRCKKFNFATNPGEFDSRRYYRILKVSYTLRDSKIMALSKDYNEYLENLNCLRSYFSSILDENFNDEDASVMKAMLLGDRTALDEEIKSLYQNAGIIHILSISGLHISILGVALYELLRKCRCKIPIACILSIFVMINYGLMCGMGTSAVRAIIMFLIRLIGKILGRTYDLLTGLSIAALFLVIEQPLYLFHSGFLMSFGAVLGIALVLPTLSFKRKFFTPLDYCLNIIIASLSVSVITLPIQMNSYYTIPRYSVFLNILVIPLMGIVLSLGIALILIGGVIGFVGMAISLPCELILHFYKIICISSTKIFGNTWYVGHANDLQVVIYYIFVGIYLFLSYYIKNYEKRNELVDEIISPKRINQMKFLRFVPILAGIIVLCVRVKPDFKMTFLHVGQGDGIVLELNSRAYLIDGGSTSRKNIGKNVLEPFLKYEGIGYLDGVIVSHEDEDHISGVLEILDKMDRGGIQIGHLFLPDCNEKCREENFKLLEQKAKIHNVPVIYLKRGDEIDAGNGRFMCLGPVKGMTSEGANAHSTILYLKLQKKNNNISVLFTGDVEKEGLFMLNDYFDKNKNLIPQIDILKVAHHGSKYTTDDQFLNLTKPKLALISCGKNNRYHHPSPELMRRLKEHQIPSMITYETGAIQIYSSKTGIKISNFCLQNN